MKRLAIAAILLVALASVMLRGANPLALPAVPAKPPIALFMVFSSVDANYHEGPWSDEVATWGTNLTTASWDAVSGVAAYAIRWGTNSGGYNWMLTTTSLSVDLAVLRQAPFLMFAIPAVPRTNYEIFFAQRATNIFGPYTDVSTNPYARVTNGDGGPAFYRLRVQQSTNWQ